MRKSFLFIFTVYLLFSCSSPFEEDQSLTVFRYNEFSNITSLDPAYAKDQANIWACNQLFNGLVQLDERLNVIPCIAKYWELDSSGTLYTFHLRNDVCFHDDSVFPGGTGRKVKASDFVYSFKRITDPALASPGAWVFNKVMKINDSYAFSAMDDSTFQIRLAEPFPPFEGILTMIYCTVVPEEAVKARGGNFRREPVGTGPFKFKTWKENVKLVLVRNEKYFESENGNRLPYLDAVAISFLNDKQSAFLEFVKGNLDFMSGLDQSYKDELLTGEGALKDKYKERFDLVSEPFLNTEYLGILVDSSLDLVRSSPLRYKEIRQAINYGFDRAKMIRYLRNNIGNPGIYGIIPPGLPAFDSNMVYYTYNPEYARQLIKEAGYSEAAQVPEMTLHTTAEYVDLFKYIQHQLGEIGLNVSIEVDPAATLMQMKAYSKIDLFRASWIADYPDEENYLSLFISDNFSPTGPNYTHFSDHGYDSLYLLSQQTIDQEGRINIYRQMNRIIMREAPVVILYYDQVLRFSQKNISGLGSNPLNLLTLKRVKKNMLQKITN